MSALGRLRHGRFWPAAHSLLCPNSIRSQPLVACRGAPQCQMVT